MFSIRLNIPATMISFGTKDSRQQVDIMQEEATRVDSPSDIGSELSSALVVKSRLVVPLTWV